MLIPSLTDPIVVSENAELARLCTQWQECAILALDTEFIRVDTFHPRLGLIQVCDGQRSYLLDPLAITEWSDFSAILGNPGILKSLHSCSEDLVVFKGFFGKVPAPLFDTQRAAAFLGFGYSISYQNLVKEVLGIEVSKDQTRSDWLRRPLSVEQLNYAALDVAYMPEITAFLQEKLAGAGRIRWAELEFEQMVTSASAENGEAEWKQYYQSLGMSWRLGPLQLSTLQSLCYWREKIAREKDKPRSWIAKDSDLIALAERRPGTATDVQKIPELSKQLMHKFVNDVLEIIAAPHSGDPLTPLPGDQPLTPPMRAQLKRCQEEVAGIAQSLGLAPELLARKKQLLQLLVDSAVSGKLSWPEDMRAWRQDVLEPRLKAVLE